MRNAKSTIRPRQARCSSRSGVATVEFAILAPFLMVLLLGAVDTGQYANVYQIVSNASREGGRLAAKFDTVGVGEVQAEVTNYLAEAFPGLSAGVQVSVTNSAGVPVPGGNLQPVESGSELTVTVTLQFDTVRWLRGTSVLDGRSITTTTVVRRE